MRSRHATAIDGARDGARDDAETPNATIQNGAKAALAETPSLEPREPFMTPHRRRTLAALRLEQSFKSKRTSEDKGFHGVGTMPKRRGLKLAKRPLEACQNLVSGLHAQPV